MAKFERDLDYLRSELSTFFPLEPADDSFEEWGASAQAGALATSSSVELVRHSLRPSLFDYQEELVEKFRKFLIEGEVGLLSLPTGGGKTRTGVVACLDAMTRSELTNAIWLAPTRELVQQAFVTFDQMWRQFGACPDVVVHSLFRKSKGYEICVTTPQEVYSRIKQGMHVGSWDAVVFDEAHQLGARTFEAAVTALRGGAKHVLSSRPGLIGLSATPGRSTEGQTDELVRFFDGNLITSKALGKNPVEMLQRRGILARLEFRRLTRRIIEVADEVSRLRVGIKACESLARRGRRVLVFTQSVAGAVCLAEALNGLKVSAASVSSRSSPRERFAVLEAFGEGRVHVLANQRLLATGYDCPAVSDVLILGPVGSAILFEQMVGRAARGPRTGGSGVARVWDFDDHLNVYGFPSSYYRYRDYEWTRA